MSIKYYAVKTYFNKCGKENVESYYYNEITIHGSVPSYRLITLIVYRFYKNETRVMR